MDQENTFAVIFDMDGVLVDSDRYIRESFRRVAEQKGMHFGKDPLGKYGGRSLRDQMIMWKNDLGVDLGDLKEFSDRAYKIQMELFGSNTNADAELLRLLQELKTKKVPMGVGTSSGRNRAKGILSAFNIDGFFSVLVTADDVSEHKPNPHVFLEVARQLNISPDKCIVIEDAASGIEAARNGGMKSIGFLAEWNSKEELSNADKIISGFGELSLNELQKMFN